MSNWQTYANYDLGFQINYPANRLPIEIHPDNTTEHIVFGEIIHGPFTIDVKRNTTIDEYIAQDFKDNPSCANRKTIKLNNYGAVFYTCENEFAGGTIDIFTIAKNNNIYAINFMLVPQGTTAENVRFVISPTDQKMLDSFRFTDDISDWQTYNNDELGLSFMYPSSIGSLKATTTEHHGETIFWPPGGEDVTLYGKAVRVYKENSDVYKSDFMLYSQTKDYRRLADGACDYPSCISTITAEQISQNCNNKPSSLGYYRECLILNNHQIEIEVYPNEASEYYAVAYMVWDHNDYPTVTTVSKIWTADPQLSPNQAQAKLKELLASEQPSSARTAYNEFRTMLSTFKFIN